MDESKEEMSSGRKVLNPFAVRKPKKRSLVERELETNMTARVTSPATVEEGVSTSRYGRARRSKSGNDNRNILETFKSPKSENTPVRVQSPITKQVVNSTYKVETPKKALETSLDNIDNIYQANKSLNRYKSDELLPKSPPSAKKFPKVYIRTDLIQNRVGDDDDDDIILIKDLFSPKSAKKMGRDSSSKKRNSSFNKQNGHLEMASVVKALDFDGNSRDSCNIKNRSGNKRDYSGNKRDSSGNKRDSSGIKRESNDNTNTIENNDSISECKPELFKGEATCPYQVGDLAWARMGTFPFWPCIITRDPESQMFVRKKLFGRVEHDIMHVTFFADNGRRSWVVDNMLRKYTGLEEFLSTREKFTAEDKKKDPRLYSAFFISEKKQSLWNTSVEEAEMINREPKNLRIDIFIDLLYKTRASKKQQKSGKVTRTDSDVSLSESLYDSLFSEDDSKVDDSTRSRNKSRNYSLDVSDVVTACLDNMAAKTGNIKIQRQSHMDRWLQKAKSKTPEKVKNKIDQAASKTPVLTPKVETVTPIKDNKMVVPNVEKVVPKVEKSFSNNKKKKLPPKEVKITKVYSLRRSYESQNALIAQTAVKTDLKDETHVNKSVMNNSETIDSIDCTKKEPNTDVNNEKTLDISSIDNNSIDSSYFKETTLKENTDTGSNAKLELLKYNNNVCKEDDSDDVLNAINELLEDSSTADSTDIISRPHDVIGESTEEKREETLSKDLNLNIKPEIMDVDNNQENNILEKPAATTQVIPNSPIKTENDLSIKNNLVNGSPVEIESNIVVVDKSSIGTISTVVLDPKTNQDGIKIKTTSVSEPLTYPDLESKQDEINNEMVSRSNDLDQTSPSLNNNEMVSIPDNCNMTDDESNSMTSVEYNAHLKDLQNHNSNLTNVSTKSKSDIVEITLKVNDSTAGNDCTVKQDIAIDKCDMSIEKPDIPTVKLVTPIKNDDTSINETEFEDITINEKEVRNEIGQSAPTLKIDDDFNVFEGSESKSIKTSIDISLNSTAKSESVLDTCKNSAREVNTIEMETDENKDTSSNIEPNPFLGVSSNIDVYKDTAIKDTFFREVNMNKPPDLTIESIAAKADLLLNGQNCESETEDSEDEPSPEYELLGDEITEDFRQHMKCIESSITDKKDEAQLVKVCNEIAIIEESKLKLADIKIRMNRISPNTCVGESRLNSLKNLSDKRIKTESVNEAMNEHWKIEKVSYEETINIDLTKTPNILTNDSKAEIQDGLYIINKAAENRLKSPLDKKKHKLSLKKDKSSLDDNRKNDNINPRYKTIEQIEHIMKNKPKRLPIENGEVNIPEIKENGYHLRGIDMPEQFDDDDFDIDDASVNSEDSEVSLSHEKVPARRSLRSKPVKKGGLEDPEFLTYMELRQDDLMEQHPELSMDDIVLYLFKTFMYTQNLKSDVKVDESLVITNNIKQETPPSRKKSKKTIQPKNTIENFFREKYKKAKKIDFDSEIAAVSDNNDYIKPKVEHCISPIDSGIGNSKDSNKSDTVKRKNKSKSPQTDNEVTKDVKVELINDANEQEVVSPKTPKRLRNKTYSPRVLETGRSKTSPKGLEKKSDKKKWPVVVISPIKDKFKQTNYLTKDKRDIRTNLKHDFDTKHEPSIEAKLEPTLEVKNELIIEANLEIEKGTKCKVDTEMIPTVAEAKNEPAIETKQERDIETESMDSDSELPLRQLRSKVIQENKFNELKTEILELKDEIEDTESVGSDNVPLLALKPKKIDKYIEGSYEDPDFLNYLELKQDNIMDENPQLSQNEIKAYLYKTWIYEKDSKSDIRKIDDIESQNLVKGLNNETVPTRKKRKPKTEKHTETEEIIPKIKPRRKTVSHYYNEAFISDFEDELEVFEIFKTKNKPLTVVSKQDSPKKEGVSNEIKTEEEDNEDEESCEEINTRDEIELYFKQLPSSKPSVFKGLIREKVCGICEDIANLIKCKGCNGSFHYDCVKKQVKVPETPATSKGRKKKKRIGRKPKNHDDSDHSDEQNVSEENISIEEIPESITIDAETLESQLEAKMKELMDKETQLDYDSYSSDDCIDWTDTIPGKCELIDVKLKLRSPPIDITNFKCNNCQKYDTPVCFVCRSAVSKTDVKIRQKCNVAHCYCYYHLECLDHWPQTQFNAGEWTKSTKKANEQFEALTCPRHVCHTCVSDDPRGCKTRFSGDKLARCVRCPATYHSFNKCLPAGTQILTASFIICPRHYEHRPGKVPCHVNTGWCFICALGGSLICCEYCPTSFHAECLNIKPPEGNYMCEDCETGRLPLYGEMVWVKLGQYRWWPGIVLHPSEIPDNIMAVKHGLGEFVVRFFGQYDHFWVNRGRVFPYQEGDSGRISSQKSKIDVAFTTAMEHAQRAFEILKNAEPDEEESLDIASSLLPPHYVKLKCNKPIGSLLGRKMEDPSLSLTQCECSPEDSEPCGPNSQCINRMLLTECGPTCRAGDRCSNRAFEKRLYPKMTPYRASHRGWGLKTLEDIKAGQFIIEYVGELIDEEEFQRRMRRKHEIRDENFYFLALDKERMIDAGPKGNLARFMNHCCEPNCETQKWTVLGDIRVGLFAIDDIKANSEVTFNYNFECTGIEKKRCLCGAKRCSGYIGAKLKQLDETQRKTQRKNGILVPKRKYTKRKNIEESPSTSKNKVKKPVGRPPKPKELTEIEKDLLIIKNATAIDEPSQSTEDNHKQSKKKTDSITTEEGSYSSEHKALKKKDLYEETTKAPKSKLDCNTMSEVSISNGMEYSKEGKTLKRKLDLNMIEEVTISNAEPSAKRIKCDKYIEVGD